MSERDANNLPAEIGGALASIPQGLVPRSIKALDRLVGAAIDIPASWLAQQKAKIDAQSAGYAAVESAIAKAAAAEAGATPEIVGRAMEVLVRKAYRKEANVQAAGVAALEDLRENEEANRAEAHDTTTEIDDDWLNVFERYAEDASTERMQRLWGRVLAGEIRRPGRYAIRTLRFLSEFSQKDAEVFTDFAVNCFGGIAPTKLAKPADKSDISDLLNLDAADIIQGVGGLGLTNTMQFNEAGIAAKVERGLAIVFVGQPKEKLKTSAMIITPLGQELLSLLPNRDTLAAARRVAHAMRCQQTEAAYLYRVVNGSLAETPIEILWQNEEPDEDPDPHEG